MRVAKVLVDLEFEYEDDDPFISIAEGIIEKQVEYLFGERFFADIFVVNPKIIRLETKARIHERNN